MTDVDMYIVLSFLASLYRNDAFITLTFRVIGQKIGKRKQEDVLKYLVDNEEIVAEMGNQWIR